mmetsp:Transcript_19971/g.30011  ORF Transcript_19971/g.30011 Transcript_19971/m.30011 type:complete len:173 (-) Transcript_19971:218-736(-)|eukprot:CAMPEP_0178922598 /NCGR_PEP_ID=MMETSP0786-20121207/16247_1 /TAXON_ID=186022 /ORGANISM="Thalassionema frauenfeldii, Strain CCMP 1798" /LENGTH=172 /DNA_ID=CAMNT_0020596989 /DNA_START=109 /DNA_END=627 /DNA_ORIENTATION=+
MGLKLYSIDSALILTLVFGGYYAAVFMLPALNNSENPLQDELDQKHMNSNYTATKAPAASNVDFMEGSALFGFFANLDLGSILFLLLALVIVLIVLLGWIVSKMFCRSKDEKEVAPSTSFVEGEEAEEAYKEEAYKEEAYKAEADFDSKVSLDGDDDFLLIDDDGDDSEHSV